MTLLDQADKYFSEGATRDDVMDIAFLKGKMAIEYAKLCKKSSLQKRKYNLHRGEVYKDKVLNGASTTAAVNDARTEADNLYGDYEVYEETAKGWIQVIKALDGVAIWLISEDKRLSDIK